MDADECLNFVLMCLDIHEQTLAKELGRATCEIDDQVIEEKIKTCKAEPDGTYTKESMNAWIVDYTHNHCKHVLNETSKILEMKIT